MDDDDDSSFQLERLIPSQDRTESTTIKSGPDLSGQQSAASTSKDATAFTSSSSIGPPRDLNECYSWLRLDRKVRKDSDSASSTDSHSSSSSSSSSSSTSSSFVSLPLPDPPDGGWGWMVVLGAFMISVICDGLAYCFGVLYAELLSQFGESKSKTSLVGSIFFGVSMILGPFASSMTTRFGCRKMTIFGGLLSCFGFVLSYFANSIEMLCITFSVIVGIGFSFCYITSVVIVAFYFKKRRSLATGLAVCGTGVGTLTFAPFMDYLIYEYGWRGLFLIMAGISLNLVVCGMLFRPLKFTERERCNLLLEEFEKIPNGRRDLEFKRMRNQSECTEVSIEADSFEEEVRTLSMMSLPTFASGKIQNTQSDLLMEALKNSRNPHLTIQRYMKNVLFRFAGRETNGRGNGRVETLISETRTSSFDQKFGDTTRSSGTSWDNVQSAKNNATEVAFDGPTLAPPLGESSIDSLSLGKRKMSTSEISTGKTQGGCERIYGKEQSQKLMNQPIKIPSFNVGRRWAYGIHMPLYRTDIFYRRWLKQNSQVKPCMLGTSCPELIESSEEKSNKSCADVVRKFFHGVSDLFSDMLELSLFTNGFFFLFVVSNVLNYFWSDVPYMYAADHAMNHGTNPRQASFIISIIGIFNTIGQVVFGFVGDMKVNLIVLYAVVSVFAGLFVALVPLVTSVYWQACIFYGLFGFCVSVSYPLTTVLMVNYLGMDKLTSAYGLLMLMQGIANLFGPPFAGWVSDRSGTYDTSFYLSGIFYALSGLVMFFIYVPACKSIQIEEKEAQQQPEIAVVAESISG